MLLPVVFWRDEEGRKPVAEYLRQLPRPERAKLAAALFQVEQHGLGAVLTRHVEGRLWELKVDAQRVFYVLVTGPECIVLHAYRKKSRRAPVTELAIARARMRRVLDQEKQR